MANGAGAGPGAGAAAVDDNAAAGAGAAGGGGGDGGGAGGGAGGTGGDTTDWKAEADRLKQEADKHAADAARNADAAKELELLRPFYNKNANGDIVLNVPGAGGGGDGGRGGAGGDEGDGVTKVEVTGVARQFADLAAAQTDIERGIRALNAADPLLEKNMDLVRATVKKVPLERRTKEVWENAYDYAAGKNRKDSRVYIEKDAYERGMKDALKSAGVGIRASEKKQTVSSALESLTPDQRAYVERRGLDPKVYVKRQAELKGQELEEDDKR